MSTKDINAMLQEYSADVVGDLAEDRLRQIFDSYVGVASVPSFYDIATFESAGATQINLKELWPASTASGGVFVLNTSMSKSEANGGTIIDSSVSLANQGTGSGLGCWIRQYGGSVNVKWFGVINDTSLTNAINYALTDGNQVIVSEDITIKIPTHVGNIQGAFDVIIAQSSKVKIDVLFESGETDSTGLWLSSGDYSNYSISSVDDVVPVDIQNNGTNGFEGHGSHFFFEDCVAPTFNCLFDAQETGGFYAAGITVRNSRFRANSGCGLINTGPTVVNGTELEIQFGYNLLVWNSSQALINSANFSGAAQRCLWVSRSSFATAANADFSNSRNSPLQDGQGAIYCTRGSWVNAEYANISSSNSRAVTCSRGYINLEKANVRNAALAKSVYAIRGGRINAYQLITDNAVAVPDVGADGTVDPNSVVTIFADDIDTPNLVSGLGVIYMEDAPTWPGREFSGEGPGWYVQRYANGTIVLQTRSPIHLTYSSNNSLNAIVTIPTDILPSGFFNTEYFVDYHISNYNITLDQAEKSHFMTFSKTETSLIPTRRSNGLWVGTDTIDIDFKLTGRWK